MELSAKVEEVQQSVVVRQESRSGEIRGHPANPPPIRREILLLQQHPRRGDGDEIQLQPLLHKVRNEHIKMINLILSYLVISGVYLEDFQPAWLRVKIASFN